MKIGTTSTVITPPVGVVLGGNGREDNRSRGIHDDLRANVLYLHDGVEPFVFVGLDLIGILGEDCAAVKKAAEKKYRIPAKNIMIFATHTHSGPNAVKIFINSEEEIREIDAYLLVLRDKLVEAIGTAVRGAFEGRLGYLRAEIPEFSHNRRVLTQDGRLNMVFEDYDRTKIVKIMGPNGYPVLNLFSAADQSGAVRAFLINYTSHPACICGEDWLYSRDFIHYLTEDLQREYGKDLVVIFANGAEGNMVWSDVAEPFVTGFDEARRVGDGIYKGLRGAIEAQGIRYREDWKIKSAVSTVRLPIRKIPPEEIEEARRVLDTPLNSVQLHGLDPHIGARELLRLAELGKTEDEAEIQAVRLGDTLIATFPGEVFIEYGMAVFDHSPLPDSMIFGLCNGHLGYIPTAQAFRQGGYEIKTAMDSRLAPEAGGLLVTSVNRLVDLVTS